MSIKNRLVRLEKNYPKQTPHKIADEARLKRIKELSLRIAVEANAQGITAKDNPALGLPLAIAEVVK